MNKLKISSSIIKLLLDNTPESSVDWFNRALDQIQGSEDAYQALGIVMAMARRKVGDELIQCAEAFFFDDTDKAINIEHWRCSDLARVIFLLQAINTINDDSAIIVQTLYSQGDEYEREAILKGLVVLDLDGSLAPLAVDACRTNILTLFAAVGLETEYPALFFSEHEYNQLVLKALFLEFDISRIIGLKQRKNPSMSRMCYEFLLERLAAKRQPPASIWRAIELDWSPEALEPFIQYAQSSDDLQRFHLVSSLLASSLIEKQTLPDTLINVLNEQLKVEKHPKIKTLLNNILD